MVPDAIQFCTVSPAVIWFSMLSAILSKGLMVITASGFTARVRWSIIGAII